VWFVLQGGKKVKERGFLGRVEEMARNAVDKAMSIDAQLRLLAPKKLSDDDKLVEYDALLLDRFLDILQDLHGADIRETV
jgi:phosphoenolpyruvate carboxylase